MHDDDEPVGRVLGRRQALALLGLAGTATLAGVGIATASAGAPDCVVVPEQMEGPYFVDEGLKRSDLRLEPSTGLLCEGTLFTLDLVVSRLEGKDCVPLQGAIVDLWHADAKGKYSDIASEGTQGTKFLRGLQVTDRAGRVRFVTILPGWYKGRTVHYHVKIRTTGATNIPYEFTSQLYLPETFTAQYLATGPYKPNGPQDTTNAADVIYQAGGDQLLLNPRRVGRGHRATFGIALDLTDKVTGNDDNAMTGPFPPGMPSMMPGTFPTPTR